MNLDDQHLVTVLDTTDILGQIDAFPVELASAWQTGFQHPLPSAAIQQIFWIGLGEASQAGELVGALGDRSKPLYFQKGDVLPLWADHPQTLVVFLEPENSPELTQTYQNVQHATTLAITAQPTLFQRGLVWSYSATSPCFAWQWGYSLALACRLGWLPSSFQDELTQTLRHLANHPYPYGMAISAANNPAKRQAGQFMERLPIIYGAGFLAPVATRWKHLLHTRAKMLAMAETLPESLHHTLHGFALPTFLSAKLIPVFIRSGQFDGRSTHGSYDLMGQLLLENGISPDSFFATGATLFEQQLHALLYGEFVSFYAAIGANQPPARADLTQQFQQALADRF